MKRQEARDIHSWPFKVFKMNYTELNSSYWAIIPMIDKERYLIKNSKISELTDSQKYFHATGVNALRIPPTIKDWNISIQRFNKWHRLNTLLDAISCFEIYLSSVIRVAIESNPGLILTDSINYNEKIDGVKLLIQGHYDSKKFKLFVEEYVKSVTKGEWSSRNKNFYNLFPDAPNILNDNCKILEELRKIRNNSAHSMGRDISKANMNRTLDNLEFPSVSEPTMMKYLEALFKIVKTIDAFLTKNVIGNYDIVYYYHKEYVLPNKLREYNGLIAIKLKKDLTRNRFLTSYSKDYVKNMIRYYHQIQNDIN